VTLTRTERKKKVHEDASENIFRTRWTRKTQINPGGKQGKANEIFLDERKSTGGKNGLAGMKERVAPMKMGREQFGKRKRKDVPGREK